VYTAPSEEHWAHEIRPLKTFPLADIPGFNLNHYEQVTTEKPKMFGFALQSRKKKKFWLPDQEG